LKSAITVNVLNNGKRSQVAGKTSAEVLRQENIIDLLYMGLKMSHHRVLIGTTAGSPKLKEHAVSKAFGTLMARIYLFCTRGRVYVAN
jgi:hypothetical protein